MRFPDGTDGGWFLPGDLQVKPSPAPRAHFKVIVDFPEEPGWEAKLAELVALPNAAPPAEALDTAPGSAPPPRPPLWAHYADDAPAPPKPTVAVGFGQPSDGAVPWRPVGLPAYGAKAPRRGGSQGICVAPNGVA